MTELTPVGCPVNAQAMLERLSNSFACVHACMHGKVRVIHDVLTGFYLRYAVHQDTQLPKSGSMVTS